MKVKFKFGIETYSGTVDSMVYGSYNDDKLCLGREYVYPRLTEQNALVGSVAENLSALWKEASVDYKDDLKDYARRNASANVPKSQLAPTCYALFIKLMYAWQESDPDHVDLLSVSSADIQTTGNPVQTIKDCIDNGFLQTVGNYEELTGAF